MEVIYRAYDGTIFESEEECYRYEERLYQVDLKRIKAYDGDGQRVTLTMSTDIDEIDYIYFPDEQSVKVFEQALKVRCVGFTVGAWYWDDEAHDWISLDNEIEKIAKVIKILGLANKMM